MFASRTTVTRRLLVRRALAPHVARALPLPATASALTAGPAATLRAYRSSARRAPLASTQVPRSAKPRIKAASRALPKNSSMRKVYEFAQTPLQPISLKNLLDFGTGLSEAVLLQSVVWLWSEIPGRLARQVVALDRLPYGLCLMPSIREIRDNYMRSFDEMTETPEPATFEACLAFTRAIEAIYARHGGMFSQVAKGIFELQREMARNNSNPEDVEAFVQFAEVTELLDKFFTTRIGIRMLLGQHIALMRQFENIKAGTVSPHEVDMVGLIDRRCSPARVAQHAMDTALTICRDATGFAPEIHVEGTTDLTFPYVADHLFYMLVELLKNSLRATVEFHGDNDLPDIKVIIAHSDENEDVAIKVSDQGGGIPRSDMPRIWSYLYTTANIDPERLIQGHLDHAATAPLAGLGYGLPISRMYARYFGGDLQLVSMECYGTDAFLHLRRLGDIEEPLPA